VIDDALFVTGGLRSGTTLLANLIGGQPDISLLVQPFPMLFIEAKRAFLRVHGVPNARYPLGHLFHDGQPPASLDAFLRNWRASSGELAKIFAGMSGYSGQLTHFSHDQLDHALASLSEEGDFAEVVATLDRSLAQTDAQWAGSKEVVCEEFLPHLLARGFRCALIVRDPRDVLASLNHGRGVEFGGEIRPTLFNIRSWRKSVAFALAMETQPRFAWCRYEDLVANPSAVLARIHASLGLADVDEERIHFGGWRGNSSHGERIGISDASVGVWRELLPSAAARLVEAACLPEIQRLDYATTMTFTDAAGTLAAATEPYPMTRADFESDAVTAENIALEVDRLREALLQR